MMDDMTMPYGKHQGKLMKDVPADYLMWLWKNGLREKTRTSAIAHYIYNHLEQLTKKAQNQ